MDWKSSLQDGISETIPLQLGIRLKSNVEFLIFNFLNRVYFSFYKKNVDKSVKFFQNQKKIFDLSTRITLLHIAKLFFIFCFPRFFEKDK